MSKGNIKPKKGKRLYRRSFKLCSPFYKYLGFLLFSVIFTQALRNSASYVLFLFCITFPFAEALYVFFAYFCIKCQIAVSSTELHRTDRLRIDLTYENKFILPYYFAEAELRMPSEECSEVSFYRVRLSAFPLRRRTESFSYDMNFRGQYDVGIKNVYIYGLFRLFRICIYFDAYERVTVLSHTSDPMLRLGENGDDDAMCRRRQVGGLGEPAGLRDYIGGDSMKHVHWKLSSKADKLLVKLYSSNDEDDIYIIPDMRIAYPPECGKTPYIGRYASDRCIEYALGAAKTLVGHGKTANIIIQTDVGEEKLSLTSDSFDECLRRVSAASCISSEHIYPPVCGGVSARRIYFVSRLDRACIELMTSQSNGGNIVYFIPPHELMRSPDEAIKRDDELADALASAGFDVYMINDGYGAEAK